MLCQLLVLDRDLKQVVIEQNKGGSTTWTKIQALTKDGSYAELTFFDGTQPALVEAMASYLEKTHGYKVDRGRAGGDRSGIDDSSKLDHDQSGGSTEGQPAEETAEGG